MAARTEKQMLQILQRRGAKRLRRISFRKNRSTIWSLTQEGEVLNLHVAYRTAPLEVLDHFAVIAREAHRASPRYAKSSSVVRTWEGLELELRRLQKEHRKKPRPAVRRRQQERRVGPCCATEEQRRYLQRLYRYLNRTRFDSRLPADVPVRLSNRMSSRLGQMMPGIRDGMRYTVEIALNVDLMLEGNGRERIDTLVHEMAHIADWLFGAGLDHGPAWCAWARYAGCQVSTRADQPIRRRGRGVQHVTNVPKLPEAARARAA